MNNSFEEFLSGGDLRSVGNLKQVIRIVDDQERFGVLFQYLYGDNRLWVMRAADAIEKITRASPVYLKKHNDELFTLLESAGNKKLKWHLALILPRLHLSSEECTNLFVKLSDWAMDSKESKIVRVNSLEGLSEIVRKYPKYDRAFQLLAQKISSENIPSINARIKKIFHQRND